MLVHDTSVGAVGALARRGRRRRPLAGRVRATQQWIFGCLSVFTVVALLCEDQCDFLCFCRALDVHVFRVSDASTAVVNSSECRNLDAFLPCRWSPGQSISLKYAVSTVSDGLCVANGVDTSRTFFVLFVRFVVCYIPRRCRKINLRSRVGVRDKTNGPGEVLVDPPAGVRASTRSS